MAQPVTVTIKVATTTLSSPHRLVTGGSSQVRRTPRISCGADARRRASARRSLHPSAGGAERRRQLHALVRRLLVHVLAALAWRKVDDRQNRVSHDLRNSLEKLAGGQVDRSSIRGSAETAERHWHQRIW